MKNISKTIPTRIVVDKNYYQEEMQKTRLVCKRTFSTINHQKILEDARCWAQI